MRLEQDIHIVNFHLAQYYNTEENLRQEITAVKERWVLEDWRLNYDQLEWTLAKQITLQESCLQRTANPQIPCILCILCICSWYLLRILVYS